MYSEEQALEDAIYYLGEGLRKDVIDLEVFLKVRVRRIVFYPLHQQGILFSLFLSVSPRR